MKAWDNLKIKLYKEPLIIGALVFAALMVSSFLAGQSYGAQAHLEQISEDWRVVRGL